MIGVEKGGNGGNSGGAVAFPDVTGNPHDNAALAPYLDSITNLENNEYKYLYWQSVSSASGTLTIPTGATVLLGEIEGLNALAETISIGKPTGNSPTTSGGNPVIVSTFDVSGNYTLSGTPSAFPVAILFVFKIAGKFISNIDLDKIIADEQIGTMIGCSDTTDGKGGEVPKPIIGDKDKVLAGSGTFRSIANILGYTPASTTNAGLQDRFIEVTGNITASNDAVYDATATATISDPTGVQGKGFRVYVRTGTCTVGGITYSNAGTIIFRYYNSGAFTNHTYRTEAYNQATYQALLTATNFATFVNSTTDKTTPVDADIVPIVDVSTGKRFSLSNLWTNWIINKIQTTALTISTAWERKGVSNNSNAATGYIGEEWNVYTTGVTITSSVHVVISSQSLPAGHYEAYGFVALTATVPNSTTSIVASVNTNATSGGLGTQFLWGFHPQMGTTNASFHLSSTTTIYLTSWVSFSSGTMSASGQLYVRRIR